MLACAHYVLVLTMALGVLIQSGLIPEELDTAGSRKAPLFCLIEGNLSLFATRRTSEERA